MSGGWYTAFVTREIEEYVIQPEDVLTETEYELFQQAQAIPCPWCDRSLTGSFYFFITEDGYQEKGVRLKCSGCS